MERESFEDEETAKLLNERFVSIKVDREERPDIDSIYMNVCQMMNGHGGWPLNIFMTPDKIPFYAGTYFPKNARFGYPGFADVIIGLSDKYREDPEHIDEVAKSVLKALQTNLRKSARAQVSQQAIKEGYEHFLHTFDAKFGGFGHAPKFPMPHSLSFLLCYYKYTGDEIALKMVVRTLESMARGGIYDHIGYGFSRYSTDDQFLVPHFEKMLYDNALLAIAYIEAYQVTKSDNFRRIAEQIFTYVLRDMQHSEGGFYSAEDADSEGEEGKFYIWTPNEIKGILGNEIGTLFCQVYDISESGNFEGKNIPNRINGNLAEFAASNGLKITDLTRKLEEARIKLFEYRDQRVHPFKDDKILTSWNGLMIAALAKGARVFENEEYSLAAERAIEFIEKNLKVDGRLMVRYRDGEVKYKGFIDDYAFLLWGYIEMYESTLRLGYLQKAKSLATEMLELFWDQEEGVFFFSGSDHEELLVRQKETYDGAIPSGNSVAAMQMLRLARLTGEYELEEKVQQIFVANAVQLNHYPEGHTFLLQCFLLTQMKMKEVVALISTNDGETAPFIKELQQGFYPEITYLVSDNHEKLTQIAPVTKDYKMVNQKTTIYVCENFVCSKPVTSSNEALKLIH